MLIYIFFMVTILIGILTWTFEAGIVRLTQQQLQSGADAGALEGVRYRDATDDGTCAAQMDDTAADKFRRCKSREMVDLVYYNPDPNVRTGAGPVIVLDPGPKTLLNQIDTMNSTPYVLKNNGSSPCDSGSSDLCENGGVDTANAQDGDMVAGNYNWSALEHTEASITYARPDFTPDTTGGAYLVRLRRTGEAVQSGIANPGPAIPFLFGRFTYAKTLDSGGEVQFKVRGTAIADARPVLRVGPPLANPPTPGVTPFAFSLALWTYLQTNPPLTLTDDGTGALVDSKTNSGVYLMRTLDNVQTASLAGSPVPKQPIAATGSSTIGAYVPIYDISQGQNIVVGFGYLTSYTVALGSPSSVTFGITPSSGTVASANASAVLSNDPYAADYAAYRATKPPVPGALLAPVLVQ